MLILLFDPVLFDICNVFYTMMSAAVVHATQVKEAKIIHSYICAGWYFSAQKIPICCCCPTGQSSTYTIALS